MLDILWEAIVRCKGCGYKSYYWCMHPANPCPDCYGQLEEVVGRWVPAVYKGWWIFKVKEENGYWEVK